MDSDKRYTAMLHRGHWCVYDLNGSKMAEVWGNSEKALDNARMIVNGLNMRHRWLQKKEESNNEKG